MTIQLNSWLLPTQCMTTSTQGQHRPVIFDPDLLLALLAKTTRTLADTTMIDISLTSFNVTEFHQTLSITTCTLASSPCSTVSSFLSPILVFIISDTHHISVSTFIAENLCPLHFERSSPLGDCQNKSKLPQLTSFTGVTPGRSYSLLRQPLQYRRDHPPTSCQHSKKQSPA